MPSDDPSARSMYGLIRTKISMPPVRSRMVERTHLLDRLSDGKDAPLIVISGVAGSGKTSLVSQWIIREKLQVAWYSIDETDNEGDLFFRYLFAALNTAVNRVATAHDRLLQDGRRLAGRKAVSYLVEYLADLSDDIYLVLDDYHFITSQEVHDALFYFLDHGSPKTHVVITTRYDVPFSLSHFKVRNRLVEITAWDMRFTEKETETFFADIIPVRLTTEELHLVVRRTEGWVGGLQFFGLSQKDREERDELGVALAKVNRDASDYLVYQVIERQPTEIKAFLQTTALIDRFNVDICKEITGFPNSADLVDCINRNNLFLIPLDTEHTWYRYHHLFSQAVRERQKVSAPDTTVRVYRVAALWFARNGYLEDAFRNAFASADLEFTADLMEDYLLFVNDRYEYASGQRWLSMLPDEILRARALLRLHECGHRIEAFQFSHIEAILNDIECNRTKALDRYEGYKRTLCEDLVTYFEQVLRYFYRDPTHADIDRLNKACEMISPENKISPGHIKILIASSHILQGRPLAASNALKEALPLIISSGTSWGRVFWYRSAATVERMQGGLRRSEAILQEAFDFLKGKGLSASPVRFLLYLPAAWACYHRNDLGKALEYAKDAATYAEQVRFVTDAIEGNLLLSLICVGKGDTEGADSHMQKVRCLSKEFDAPDVCISPDPWTLRLSSGSSNMTNAAEWPDHDFSTIDQPFTLRVFHDRIAWVEVLLCQGRSQQAGHLLEQLRQICVERNLMEAVLEIDLCRCAHYSLIEERDKAKDILRTALAFAESEGYVRLFVDHSTAIFSILNDVASESIEHSGSSHLREIVSLCRMDGNRRSSSKRAGRKGGSELTDRETEVLKLMASGYTYKDIALQLSVSLETVRTHARHILEKLNAGSKSQAIRRAKGLQLL